jgi:hypothetical protein
LWRYGGILLGPVRFTHIETCARDVSRTFRKKEDIDECVSTLRTLDDLLSNLRAELRQISADPTAPPSNSSSTAASPLSSAGVATAANLKTTNSIYDYLLVSLDVSKARKLVTARESAVKTVKSALAKKKSQTSL